MARLLMLAALGPWAAACGTAAVSPTPEVALNDDAAADVDTALCSDPDAPRFEPVAYASWDAYRQAKLGEYGPKSPAEACEDEAGRCGGDLVIVDGEPLQHDVVLMKGDGKVLVFEGPFQVWSGAFCPWDPVFVIEGAGRYATVTMTGMAWARWEGECSEDGEVEIEALVDRTPGAERLCKRE